MTRIPARQRSASLRRYYRRRAEFLAAGLTVMGRPRKRVFKKYFTPAALKVARRQWSYSEYRRRRDRNLAAGLTERGTPRIYRQWPELRGLKRPEYDRVKYRLKKKALIQTGLAALVAGKGGLITKLNQRDAGLHHAA
jgi:hypothetical protein